MSARFSFAWQGIRLIWRREKTFRLHCLFALAALGTAALLGAGPVWWAMIVLCTSLVFAFEAMNSALEYAIDRLHPEIHEEIGHAKDAAAGAVLLAGMGAAIVGTLMLLDWSLR